MSDGEQHAKYSASRAHRYMACAGSVTLEAPYPDTSSAYADEGTAAHILAAMCLQDKVNASEFMGEHIHVSERKFKVDHDMIRYVQMYVDDTRQRAKGKTLLVEVKVPIGHFTGEEGAQSTSDAIVVNATQRRLVVSDLKYGRGVEVEAENSEQGMIYALGALEACSLLGDFDTVEIVIFQPRLSSEPKVWTTTVKDLEAFAAKVRAAVDHANNAERDHGTMDADEWASNYLRPGEKQCKFCKAKATCPALLFEMTEIVGEAPASAEDFAQFAPVPVTEDTGGNFLSVALSKVDLVEEWCKAVRAEALRRLTLGQKIDGFKLVEGKMGNRAWRDADAAEAKLKALRLKQDEMYDRKIISPTAAEKLLKKDKPKQWEALEKDFITRAPGKPSIAPAKDKRPAISVAASAEDFRQFASENAE
jgi:hypothetical protein